MMPRFLPGAKSDDGWCGGNGLQICRGDIIQGLQNRAGNAGKSFIYEDLSNWIEIYQTDARKPTSG